MNLLLALGVVGLAVGTIPAATPPVTALAISPDGREVVVGSQAGLEVRTWPGLEPARSLGTELDHVHDLAFSPDGKTLAAVGGTPARRGTVELLRWPSGELVRRFSPHRDLIYAVTWRADSAAVATAGADSAVWLHPVAGDVAGRKLDGHSRGVLAAVFLPGDAGLLSAGVDASLRLWDHRTDSVMRTLSHHTQSVNDLAVRPVGGMGLPFVVSVGDDRTVRFWQPTIGRLVRFARLTTIPFAVVWTPDGQAVVVACKDGRVRRIDPDTAQMIDDQPAVEGPAYALAVAPNGALVVGGANGAVKRVTIGPLTMPR